MMMIKFQFNLFLTTLYKLTKILTIWFLLSSILSYLTTVDSLSSSSSPSSLSSSSSSSSSSFSSSIFNKFYFEIEENSQPGKFVGKIPTKPGFSYRFNDEPLEFSLDPQTGVIVTSTTSLDRETKDFYNLVVLSSSPTYPIEVKIKILDLNDNAPFWPSYINRNVSFSESAPIGTKLILDPAVDLDEGYLTYEIVQTASLSLDDESENVKVYNHYLSPSIPFRLNYNLSSSFLHLEVSDNLDRETQANYILNISATDQQGLQAFLVLYVQILDVNDNPPIFDHSDYSVSLNESVGKGTSILQVRATDSDEEGNENSAISYYLLSEKYFTIDPVTGVVYIAQDGSIDCGTPASSANSGYRVCVFTVFAHDHGTPRQNGRAYVTIHLLDSNDHEPQIKFRYLSRSDQASVDENAANGSVVTAVSVVDLDHGPNGETSLSIIGGNQFGHFRLESISNSHIIRVNGSLDREKVSKYNLTLFAIDHGSPPRSSTANLIINVNDVNDHEPIFNRELYEVSLAESLPIGSFVTSVSAIDLDEGINANLYYSLSGPNAHFFKIDTITGLVTTEKKINREENESFELRVMARDGGPNPKWAYASLKINILDINDEVPALILPETVKYDNILEANVYELEENNRVSIELTTVDRDEGVNGTVDCSLLFSYNGLFEIDTSSKPSRLISTRKLNYEECNEFKLSIIAKDRGIANYQLSSATILIIKVFDKDDHLPSIYPTNYFAFIPFHLSSLNYSIVVSRVMLLDADLLSPVSFQLKPQASQSSLLSQIFHLNSKTGEIHLKAGLTIDSKSLPNLFKFNISCQTCDPASNQAQFSIYIIHPESRSKAIDSIKREYTFEISESASVGTIIGKIDIDTDKFKLNIVSGDSNGQFMIDGVYIKNSKLLDHESISHYKLQLIAYNDQVFVQIDVKINLIDVNDNQPVFSGKFIELNIPIDVPPKLTIYRFKAYDPDLVYSKASTQLSEIRYQLVNNSQDLLTIDGNELKINRPLIKHYSGRLNFALNVLSVEVKAIDPGALTLPSSSLSSPSSCQLNNHLFIYLHIKNVNKHKPRFESSFYEMSLSESIAVNNQFLKISAVDDDGDDIEYKIVDGNVNQAFGIFPDGTLFIRHSLDREETEAYSLRIIAFENKLKSDSNGQFESNHLNSLSIDKKVYQSYFNSQISCQVIIHVIDENDHPPQFVNSSFRFKIKENSDTNTLIGQVMATDADKGANSEVHYALVDSNFSTLVEIDSYTGHLWSKAVFDAEQMSQLQLEVTAFDQSFDSERLTSTATVIIDIIDVNDNPPKFIVTEENGVNSVLEMREEYQIENIALSEDTKVGSKLLTLKASDADANSKIFYKLLDSAQISNFHLNSSTGGLRLARSIDRESVDLVEILVSANDGYFEAYKLLRFMIEDVNDNAPRFVNFTLNEVTVSEDAEIGTVILSLFAIDPDLGANGQFKFELTHLSNGPNKQKYFDILGNTLIVAGHLDFETEPVHYLNISAVDTFGLRSEIKLFKVTLLDANDCVPTFQSNLNPSLDVIKVSENIKKGSKLMTIQAFDCDENDELRYEIANFNIFQESKKRFESDYYFNIFELSRFGKHCPISINPITGDLVTTDELDREMAETIQLQIVVRDKVNHVEKKQVTVILEDINDNYPVFVSPNAIVLFGSRIEENQILGVITAIDADTGINSAITYKLDSESNELFNLDPKTGQLRARHPLDTRMQKLLTVMAVDGAGLVTSDELNFILISRGRYLNQIQVSELTLEVYENEPFGVRLHKFKCMSSEDIEKCEFFINKAKDRTFAVDQYSGDLYLKSVLDREATDYHNLELVAIQGIQVHINKVTIRVLDKNDNPPVIDFDTSAIFVSEATPFGAEIFDISEATKDMDAESQLEYKLINCFHCHDNTFEVDTYTGKVFLKESLDREYISKYHLKIGVSDSVHFTTGQLDIVVIDINDNPPRFNQTYYSFDILENTERGVVVGIIQATDLDEFSHHITYLMISEQNPDDAIFSLNEKTGEFTLNRHLDYETDPNHFIIVCQAFDGKFKSEKVNVYFNLINLNDNWPVFDPVSYRVELFENVTVGTQILCVSATDSDFYQYYDGSEKNNTSIKYYFQIAKEIFNIDARSSVIHQFKISENTGCIELIQELDRETISVYDITVVAHDGYFKTTANLQVKVKDVNDNPPRFDPKTPLVLSVSENLGPYSIIHSFKAYDKDEVPNNYIQYELEHDGKDIYNQNFPFAIGAIDGLLRLTEKLDRETSDVYHFIIRAKDYGSKSSEIKITIQVIDVNDNSPQFEQNEFHLSVPENASLYSRILKFSATDLDKPDKISYHIASGDIYGHFKIIDNELVVIMALDYERISSYDLKVQAIDKGNNYDTARVVIDVLNVHDEAPQFVNSPYFLNWCENEIGILGHFPAIGELLEGNKESRLNYLLKNNYNQYFELNSTNALLSVVKPIDREALGETNSIELRIIAIDKRLPRLTGEGIMLINIIDVNDNKPSFSKDQYIFNLVENHIYYSKEPFGKVEAHDIDSSDEIVYRIVDNDFKIFTINHKTGELSLHSDMIFDREKKSMYTLTIEARDSKYEVVTKANIVINDMNDCKPMFKSINNQELIGSQQHNFELTVDVQMIKESKDLFVAGFYVTDCDQEDTLNSKVKFDLVANTESQSLFHIDSNSGVLRAYRAPESSKISHHLKIVTHDMSPKDPLNNTLNLKINFVQNSSFKPKRIVELVHEIMILESIEVNKIVHTFQLLSTSNDQVEVFIIGGDPYKNFVIDQKFLKINKPLDYEECNSYDLFIQAVQKSGNETGFEIMKVKIEVINENDNAPKFEFDVYNATVLEEVEESLLVIQLFANDKDLNNDDLEDKLTYSIVSPLDAPFKIDEKYGAIWTTSKTDREVQSEYTLVVSVKDEAGLVGYCKVLVTVEDKNDNPPRFTRLFSVNVTENAPIGAMVIQVTSSDKDSEAFAQATYSFIEPSNIFEIEPNTGEVFVIGNLDREIKDEYLLMVSANDKSWKAQTTLTVSILDENDNSPIFEKDRYEFRCKISSQTDTLGQVRAKDIDKGPNSMISYTFKHTSQYFAIDTITGVIKLKPYAYLKLAYNSNLECLNQHNLTVIASDHGIIPKSTEAIVIITILPNQEMSELSNKTIIQTIPVPYNLENGTVLYHLDHHLISDFVETNQIIQIDDSNVVYKGNSLVKKGDEFAFKFESINHELSLNIIIIDPNNYSPQFVGDINQVMVAENEDINNVLLQVKAIDEDLDPYNSELIYDFEVTEWQWNEKALQYFQRTSKSEMIDPYFINLPINHLLNRSYPTSILLNPFKIDSSNGVLHLNNSLDYELITGYKLKITIKDKAWFDPKNASTTIIVHVTDVNDNSPIFENIKDGTIVMEVYENNPIGFIIGKVEAIDFDSLRYSHITFDILNELDYKLFSIDSKTGLVQALVSFDYEQKRDYQFKVLAKNDKEVSSMTTVKVKVKNVNEHKPRFKERHFVFDVFESSPIGTVLGSLKNSATDEDYNEPIHFYLIKNKKFGVDIDRNGTLRIVDKIDFSKAARHEENIFPVIVKNSGPIKSKKDYDEAQVIFNLGGVARPYKYNQTNYICKLGIGSDNAFCKEEVANHSPDPMSIGLILVILFFVVLILVISTSFIIFHHQKNKQMRNCANHARKMGIKHHFVHQINGSSSQSSTLLHTSLHNQTLLSQPIASAPHPSIIKQRPPDIIESPPLAPPVTSRAPPVPPLSYITPYSDNYSDVIGAGEHYDLENASSIAPSEFDLVYRCKGFKSGRESVQPQSQHRHAPLSRISPSVTELTAPRILTLQDLSPQRVPPCPPPNMAPPPLPPLLAKRQPILTPNLDANKDGDNSDGTYTCSEYNSNYKLNKKPKNIMFERVW